MFFPFAKDEPEPPIVTLPVPNALQERFLDQLRLAFRVSGETGSGPEALGIRLATDGGVATLSYPKGGAAGDMVLLAAARTDAALIAPAAEGLQNRRNDPGQRARGGCHRGTPDHRVLSGPRRLHRHLRGAREGVRGAGPGIPRGPGALKATTMRTDMTDDLASRIALLDRISDETGAGKYAGPGLLLLCPDDATTRGLAIAGAAASVTRPDRDDGPDRDDLVRSGTSHHIARARGPRRRTPRCVSENL